MDVDARDCLLCSEESVCELHQEKHEEVSTQKKTFQCKICNKILKKNFTLKKHMELHIGLKEFKCDLCSKEFSQKAHLNSHLKSHMGIKEFKCHVCNKEFTDKSNLTKHLKTHSLFKEFKCHICNKEFIRKCILKSHYKTHSALREFKCDVCCKKFKYMMSLRNHLAAHSEEFGVIFQLPSKKNRLKAPSVAHSQLKKFRCLICSDEFSDKLNLQQHMLKHNDQMIVVQNSSSSKEDVDMSLLESDPDDDPLLIEDEIPPVVKQEVPDLTLSEETPSMLNGKDFIRNECSINNENNADNGVLQKYICDAGDIVGDFVKVEEFSDNDYEVT